MNNNKTYEMAARGAYEASLVVNAQPNESNPATWNELPDNQKDRWFRIAEGAVTAHTSAVTDPTKREDADRQGTPNNAEIIRSVELDTHKFKYPENKE